MSHVQFIPGPLQLYGSNVTTAPEQVQQSFFRSILAFDKSKLEKAPPLKIAQTIKTTKATGDLLHDQKLMPNATSNVYLFPVKSFYRVPDSTFTYSMNAIFAAQYAAYCYFHKDIQPTEEFLMTFTDIRDISDFLYRNNCIQGLDFKKHLGMQAAVLAFLAKGTQETTIEQLLQQISVQYEKFVQTSEESKLARYASFEYTSILKRYPIAPITLNASNVGKNDLGVGPIIQSFNHTTCKYVEGEPQFLMIWPTLNSGKYGMFVCNFATPEFSKTKQYLTMKISMMVHDLVRTKGAANVTVADIVQIYQNEFKE